MFNLWCCCNSKNKSNEKDIKHSCTGMFFCSSQYYSKSKLNSDWRHSVVVWQIILRVLIMFFILWCILLLKCVFWGSRLFCFQSDVQMNTELFIILHHLHNVSHDGNSVWNTLVSPDVYSHLLCSVHIQENMIISTHTTEQHSITIVFHFMLFNI